MKLVDRVKGLPEGPGVYLFKDKKKSVIYIGKAKNLRRRVSSYFGSRSRLASPKIGVLAQHIDDLEVMPTPTEEEALIFETALISEKQPKYNTLAKDDKSYPYLKITNEKYPRLLITRNKKPDGSDYFGPFTHGKLLNSAVKILQRLFPMRTCRPLGEKICLEYHIGKCALAPCVNKGVSAEYQQIVDHLRLFLKGKKKELIEQLAGEMADLSEKLEYEKAARIRQTIEMLKFFPHIPSINYNKELIDLARVLKLKSKPSRIEAFDISNISGADAVASQVCFKDGRPSKKDYRKFRIRTVGTINDYAMMHEAILRRFGGSLAEKLPVPDLIVIDGGKGQLSSARRALLKTRSAGVPVIGIAKKNEDIYQPGMQTPLRLSRNAEALHIIQRIRDEAHRFALSYHRSLKRQSDLASALDDIEGIGDIKKKNLLSTFGSVEMIRRADEDELLKIERINQRDAKRIVEFFKGKKIYRLSN